MQMTFDTHSFVKRLIKADFSEKQAEAVINIMKEIKQDDLNVIATKRDLKELELATKRDLKELELKITIKLGGIVIACTGILLAGIPIIMKAF